MKISLPNRDGDNTYLEQIGNSDLWHLVTPYSYRLIGENPIKAIDPSGGPMLCVGSTIQNKKITDITFGGILKLEDVAITD